MMGFYSDGKEMGLSSLPGPSEGMLCIILVNTALSISMFKGMVRSVLDVVGIHLSRPSSSVVAAAPSEIVPFDFLEEFRNRTPTLRFESLCRCKKEAEEECSVCLSKFEGESEINKLKCGHLFHKTCLEKWIDYWNITCPLCRTPLVQDQQVSSSDNNVW